MTGEVSLALAAYTGQLVESLGAVGAQGRQGPARQARWYAAESKMAGGRIG